MKSFPHLSETEVRYFDIAALIEQNILRLQITVHEVHLVHILKSKCHLGGIESGVLLVELANSFLRGGGEPVGTRSVIR